MNLYHYLGVGTRFDPSCRHVTSPILSPWALAIARLILAGYTLFALLFTLIWTTVREDDGASFLSYFTHLSYIGLCAYFFAAGVQTFAFARSSTGKYPLQKWPRPLQMLHVVLEATIATYPIVVTVVFWAILADPSVFASVESAWENISLHILNLVFAVCEILLTNIPPLPWLTLPFGIFFLACYLGLAYITYATQHFYPYAFLDPKKEKAFLAAYVLGILIGYCIVFVLIRYLIVLRARIFARCGTLDENVAVASEAIDEWEEVDHPNSKDGESAV
ncbi:hypothetical protein H0H92_006958 [Tricholoma furcatifolium]|nr:hypothetical protein H0H92_006958 [Tricholoma furcatifolium]